MKVFIQYTFLLYIIFFKLVVSEAAELPDMEKYVAETGAQVKAIIQENNRLIEIGAGVTGTYLVDKCLATDGIATLTTTIATSYNESLFEKYNGDVLIIIHIIYPEGQGGKKDVLDSTLLYSQRITSLLDPQKTKTTVHFWQVVNHEADQLYSFEHVIEASNINPVVAFDYEAIKLQVTSCSNLVCSIGAYAGIGGTTSTSGLNALYAKNQNAPSIVQATGNEIKIPIATTVFIRFSATQNIIAGGQNGLRDAFSKMFHDPLCQTFFTDIQIDENAVLNYWINDVKWHWVSAFNIPANTSYEVTFSYGELWKMTSSKTDLNTANNKIKQYVYDLYAGDEFQYIRTDILDRAYLRGGFQENLDKILRVAELAKLLGKDQWIRYAYYDSHEYSDNWDGVFSDIYAFYKSSPSYLLSKILLCNTTGAGISPEGMTNLVRQLSDAQFLALSDKHRIHIFNVMAGASVFSTYVTGLGEEELIIKILASTPGAQADAIFASLSVRSVNPNIQQTEPLVKILDGKFNGANYNQFVIEIVNLYKRNSTFNTKLTQLLESPNEVQKRIVNWQVYRTLNNKNQTCGSVGLTTVTNIKFLTNGHISYDLEEIFKDTYYSNYCSDPATCPLVVECGFDKIAVADLAPFEMVFLVNYEDPYSNVTTLGTGELGIFPAYYLQFIDFSKDVKDIIRTSTLVIDAATIVGGPIGILNAATKLRRAYVFFEFANAGLNVTLNLSQQLPSSQFQTVIDISNGLSMAFGVGELSYAVSKIDISQCLSKLKASTAANLEAVKTKSLEFIKVIDANKNKLLLYSKTSPALTKLVDDLISLRNELAKRFGATVDIVVDVAKSGGLVKDVINKRIIKTISKYDKKLGKVVDYPMYNNVALGKSSEGALKKFGDEVGANVWTRETDNVFTSMYDLMESRSFERNISDVFDQTLNSNQGKILFDATGVNVQKAVAGGMVHTPTLVIDGFVTELELQLLMRNKIWFDNVIFHEAGKVLSNQEIISKGIKFIGQ